MRYPEVGQKSVLVTGCSSGIGAGTAVHLKERGWRVFPTARKATDLDQLKAEGFEAIELDIANEASVERAVDTVLKATDGGLGGVVNNAGFGQPGAIEDLSREAMRYQFEVNVLGLQDLTNRLVPTFRAQGFGRIVHVSSVLGRVSLPFMGIYSASKYAVEAMADAMRVELRGSGVAVSLVEPGPIKTRFGVNSVVKGQETLDENAPVYGARYRNHLAVDASAQENKKPEPFTLPPEAVAAKIAHALEASRPRIRYPVTIPAHIGAWMRRLAPDAFVDYLMWFRTSRRYNDSSR